MNVHTESHEHPANGNGAHLSTAQAEEVQHHQPVQEPEADHAGAHPEPRVVDGVVVEEVIVMTPRRDHVWSSVVLALALSCWAAYYLNIENVGPLADFWSKGFLIPSTPEQIKWTMFGLPVAYLAFHLFRRPVSLNWFARYLDVVVAIVPLVIVALGWAKGDLGIVSALVALSFIVLLSNISRARNASTEA